MDAAVRAGAYDDALDLRAYVAKMALLHADLAVRAPVQRSSCHPQQSYWLSSCGMLASCLEMSCQAGSSRGLS